MEGQIGTPDWEACDGCHYHGDDGCHEDIEIAYSPRNDAIVCMNFLNQDDVDILRR